MSVTLSESVYRESVYQCISVTSASPPHDVTPQRVLLTISACGCGSNAAVCRVVCLLQKSSRTGTILCSRSKNTAVVWNLHHRRIGRCVAAQELREVVCKLAGFMS